MASSVRSILLSSCKSANARRTFSCCSVIRATQTATSATASAPSPVASSSTTNPKVSQIVDQIAGLSLLEASELVTALKTRLNISEVSYAAPSGPAASGDGAAAAAAEAAPEAEKPKEKTTFNVNLTKIDSAQKAKAIREVKAVMPNMNLVEAKKFVESLPKVLKENASKEEAEKLKKALEAVGAEVKLD